MKYAYLLVTLLLVFSTVSYSEEYDKISFVAVKDNCQECSMSEYSVGKELFDSYKFFWLSDNFLIKNDPDVIFTYKDITNILVDKVGFSTKNQPNSSVITVGLTPVASDKLKHYTEGNVGSKVALMVNNKIVTILDIRFKLENEFSFSLRKSKIKIEEIFKSFREKLMFQK